MHILKNSKKEEKKPKKKRTYTRIKKPKKEKKKQKYREETEKRKKKPGKIGPPRVLHLRLGPPSSPSDPPWDSQSVSEYSPPHPLCIYCHLKRQRKA
jgi:hypothetical protein